MASDVNGNSSEVESEIAAAIGSSDFDAWVQGSGTAFNLTMPLAMGGQRESTSEPFAADWSYVMAAPRLSTLDGLIPFDLETTHIVNALGRRTTGAEVNVTLAASNLLSTTSVDVSTSLSHGSQSGVNSRMWATTSRAISGPETTWVEANPIGRSQSELDLHFAGPLSPNAIITFRPPPGWPIDDIRTPVEGWSVVSSKGNWSFSRQGNGTDPFLEVIFNLTAQAPLFPYRMLDVELSNGSYASAQFPLVYPGADAAQDQQLLVNAPRPWISGTQSRFAITFLNGGTTDTTFRGLCLTAPNGTWDTRSRPWLNLTVDRSNPLTIEGSFANGNRTIVFPAPAGAPVSLEHIGQVSGPESASIPSGVSVFLVDAVLDGTPASTGPTLQPVTDAIQFAANGYQSALLTESSQGAIDDATVLPQTVMAPLPTSASVPCTGPPDPPPAAPAGPPSCSVPSTIAGGYPVVPDPTQAYTGVVTSPELPASSAGVVSFQVVPSSTAVNAHLVQIRNADLQSGVVLNRSAAALGSSILVDSDYGDLFQNLTQDGATGIRHSLAIYAPPSLGQRPTLTVPTSEGLTSLLSPLNVSTLANLTGNEPDVVLAGGERVVALRSTDGALLWKSGLNAPVLALATLRATDGGLDSIAVLGGGSVQMLGADGTPGALIAPWPVTALASGPWQGTPRLVIGGELAGGTGAAAVTDGAGTILQSWTLPGVPAAFAMTTQGLLVVDRSGEVYALANSGGAARAIGNVGMASALLGNSTDFLGSTATSGAFGGSCRGCQNWTLHDASGLVLPVPAGNRSANLFEASSDGTMGVYPRAAGVAGWTGNFATMKQVRSGVIGSCTGSGGVCEAPVVLGSATVLLATVLSGPNPAIALCYESDGAIQLAWIDAATGEARSEAPLTLAQASTSASPQAQNATLAANLPTALVPLPNGALVVVSANGSMTQATIRHDETAAMTAWTPVDPRPGVFPTYLRVPAGGFLGTYVVVSTLSWQDPVLGVQESANMLATFDVVGPDGQPGGIVYRFVVDVWDPP
ncbi:MAG: hypothetical protein ACYDDF_03545 [Thermoplasmatota archaeon]